MIVFLAIAAIYDLKYMIIPNFVPFGIAFLGTANIVASNYNNLGIRSIIEIVCPYILGMAVALSICICSRMVSKEGLGQGDIKLLISLGYAMGIAPFLKAVIIMAAVSFLVGCGLLILRLVNKKTCIPFAPFIALGCMSAMAFEVVGI